MNLTLFGYPKTGKSSLFNILTGAHLEIHAFEAGKREANERVTPLPDARLDRLAGLYPEKKKVAAAVEVFDLAGISYGEVKTSVFLNALRKADALVHVVRGFHDDEIPHPKNRVSPADDIRTMEEEIVLSDLLSIEARLERLDKDLKKMKIPEGEKEREILLRLKARLDGGLPLRGYAFPGDEEKSVRAFAFLSRKPILHLINADESDIGRLGEIERAAAPEGPRSAALAFCGKIEREILEIEDEEERRVFRAEYGLQDLTAPRFFPLMMDLLDQIFFYTIGKDEVRAWPLRRSASALKAAGAIHTDIEHGFIRAEVIGFDDLVAQGSWPKAKDKGHIRLEGKDYVVRDGDVIYFRFAT